MESVCELGEITCPSGQLVVIDGGHLGLWSGDASPADLDPASLGIHDPQQASLVRDAVDLLILGPDAAAAARSFGRQPGTALYDIPAPAVAALTEQFTRHCADNGRDAHLEPSPARVPHRERARRCIARGEGSFHVHGVPVVTVGGLPTDRPLPIYGVRAKDSECWAWIQLQVSDHPAAAAMPLGRIGVDWARVLFGDADALGCWQHDEPVDGLADVAFWGLSQGEAATTFDAPPLGEPGEDGVRGWRNLPVIDAAERARQLLAWRDAAPGRRMMVDFRPHSHHWQIMRQVRASALEAGRVTVGGADMLCAMTTWGDGYFPVSGHLDADGALVSIRITFADDETR